MCEVRETCDRDGLAKADGRLMLPKILRQVTSEGISSRLVVPHVGKVFQGAQ